MKQLMLAWKRVGGEGMRQASVPAVRPFGLRGLTPAFAPDPMSAMRSTP